MKLHSGYIVRIKYSVHQHFYVRVGTSVWSPNLTPNKIFPSYTEANAAKEKEGVFFTSLI